MNAYIVCLVTLNDLQKATEIARLLLEREIVACVNLVPGIRSLYRWKGEICEDEEILMILKTREELFDRLRDEIRQHHPYEVPEVISWRIERGLDEYLQWIHDATSPKS